MLLANLLLYKFIERIKTQNIYSLAYIVLFVLISIGLIAVYCLDYTNVGLAIFTLGTLSNALVVTANNGFMPVDIDALRRTYDFLDTTSRIELEKYCLDSRRHIFMTAKTKFNTLGDKFGLDVSSIGDFLLDIGGLIVMGQFTFICLIRLGRLFH